MKRGSLLKFWQPICASPSLPIVTISFLIVSIFLGDFRIHRYRDVVAFAVEPFLIAVLIVQLIKWHVSPLWSWLEWSLVRYLGRISYSLYLYQQLTLHPLRKIFAAQPLAVQLVAAIIGTVLIASSYYFIERPFLKLRKFWSGRLKLVAAA